MRLCVLGPLGSIHLQRWLRYFVERGHEVHVVAYSPAEPPAAGVIMHALTNECAPRFGHAAVTGLRWLWHGLRGTMRAIKPDVLNGHFVTEHGYYAALSGYSPLAVSAWGSDLLIHPRESILNRMLVRYTIRRSALVHTFSPILTDAACAFGAARARTLTAPLGIEASWLSAQPAPGAGRPVILSMRAFSEIYDMPTLVRAVDALRRTHPDVLVKLAGDGPLRPSLNALVDQLGLRRHVEFLGRVPHARLVDVLREANVYVSTSLSDGTSVSLLEAMAVGLVPVVTDIPANREWVRDGDNGFLAAPRDADAFAHKLGLALERAEWRQQAAARNKDLIRTRALWEDQMGRVETAFQNLARR